MGARLLKPKTGIFLGAGFSKWAADLPLVNNLFDFSISEIRTNDKLWIKKLEIEKKSWDETNPGLGNEQFIENVILNKGVQLQSYLKKYLARRLSEPFLCKTYGSHIQTFMYNDKDVCTLDSIRKVKKFFDSIEGGISGIITVNYDLIVEYALGTTNFNYGVVDMYIKGRGHNRLFPWQHIPVLLTGKLILSKLHGSVSFDGKFHWSSGICGLNGKVLIVPPSPEKYMHDLVAPAWADARMLLNSVETLIVFGFNFNEYDIAVLELLKNHQEKIKKVIIYDVESKIVKAQKIWVDAKIIERQAALINC